MTMNIPKEFTLFGNKITIKEVEKTDENNYGYWNDVKEEIVIAHKIKDNEGYVDLTPSQITATFLHEMIHAMQWFSGKEYNEIEAQTYSNMLMEIIKSSGAKITIENV